MMAGEEEEVEWSAVGQDRLGPEARQRRSPEAPAEPLTQHRNGLVTKRGAELEALPNGFEIRDIAMLPILGTPRGKQIGCACASRQAP
jgi:hypothetical protein